MTTGLPPTRGTDPQAIAVVNHLQNLAAALVRYAARVRIEAERATITVTNPHALAGDGELAQMVALSVHDDGSMHWYWCWHSTPGRHPEYEYLSAAADVDAAARQIARVLRLTGDA